VIAYLSGAMEYAVDEGSGWRIDMTSWLSAHLGHDVIDPVKESRLLMLQENSTDYRTWKESDTERYRQFVRKCVDRDIRAVTEEVDYIICLWNANVLKGAGTHGEVTLAFQHNVPVYLVNQIPLIDLSGWIMACSSEIFNNFEELKAFLLEKYDS
jgi:hypothetical protein|tara:strand:- start:80 stop:544 length:465 start_codon:yes stop_codon:yes gene_type:complete